MKKRRNVYIIAGCNGAGKTTFAATFLPRYAGCVEFVNADLIAKGLSPFAPEKTAIKAGRLVLERIAELSMAGKDFAFEATLSGLIYAKLLSDLKSTRYLVHLIYLWIPSPALAIKRIRDRVATGGHDVPERDVQRRFLKSLHNLFYPYAAIADIVSIFDNSGTEPRLIAEKTGAVWQILDHQLFDNIYKEAHL